MTYSEILRTLEGIIDYRRDELFGYTFDEPDAIFSAAKDICAVHDAMMATMGRKVLSPRDAERVADTLDDIREYSEMMAHSWEGDLLEVDSIWATDAEGSGVQPAKAEHCDGLTRRGYSGGTAPTKAVLIHCHRQRKKDIKMTYEMEQMLKDEARRNIREFWQREFNNNDEPAGDFIPLAYTTVSDSEDWEHDWQSYADLNRICITHVIDGMFEHEDKYSSLAFLAEALKDIGFDDLYRDGCTIVEVFEAQGKFEEV